LDLDPSIPDFEEVRRWYFRQETDAAHDFDHILRVYHLALRLAEAEGANRRIVQAAALLHDVKSGLPGSRERDDHHLLSAEFAGEVLPRWGWCEEDIAQVQHCIRAHRFRDESEQPQTIEAKVIYDADKLDVLGAVGIIRTVAYSVLAGEPVYAEPSQRFILSGEKENGEPHSSYHEFLFKLSRVKDRMLTESGRQLAIDRHIFMVNFFSRLRQEMEGKD